jgi:transketolase
LPAGSGGAAAAGLSEAAGDLLNASDDLISSSEETLELGEQLIDSAEGRIPEKADTASAEEVIDEITSLLSKDLAKIDSDLSGHVEIHVPGVDMSGGSLGQGLSVAVGMAMYAKSNNVGNYVYAIMGDGEIQEGQIWEAAMSAGFFKVNNLIAFVDNNKIQLDGRLSEIMDPNPIDEKFRAFNWNVISVNGQDVEEIANAIDEAKKSQDKPTMILAHTTKGAGVSVFEDTPRFHGGQPTPEEYELAIKELNDRIASLEV